MNQYQEIDELKRMVDQVEIVSFDVFDTLLLRNVMQPTDIFDIVENTFYSQTKERVEFKQKRIWAENQARKKSKNEDVTFAEIYQELTETLGEKAVHLKALELEIEDKFLITNTIMKEVYEYAVEKNKAIYIISDMYIDKSWLESVLIDRGYNKYKKVFISSEMMKSKATGTLYQYIRDKEDIQHNNWLHIGDNGQADYRNAIKAGMKAYHYKAVRERYTTYKCDSYVDSLIRAVQINYNYLYGKNMSYWQQFGHNKVAPLVVEFMIWLEKELENKDNVYFLARDGYLPFELYKMLCIKNSRLPKGKYLYASRRAYTYPGILYVPQSEAIEWLMAANKNLGQTTSIRKIFNNLGLSVSAYSKELKQFNMGNVDQNIESEKDIKNTQAFLNTIWEDIKDILEKEKDNLDKYLQQEKVLEQKEINIVDIGWSGSTHRALSKIVHQKINGYYVGSIEQIYDEIKPYSKAYLFNEGRPRKKRNFVIDNVMIFEFIFSAPMGSVINFKQNGNQIVPNIVEVEKNEYLYEVIKQLQQGVIEVFNEIMKYKEFIDVNLNGNIGFKILEDFIKNHSIKDMVELEKLSSSIGFGDSGDIKQYVYRVSSEEYLTNRKEIHDKASELLWKNAILVEDELGRVFNTVEFINLKQLKRLVDTSKLKKLIYLAKKGISNPQKGVKWILKKIKVRL